MSKIYSSLISYDLEEQTKLLFFQGEKIMASAVDSIDFAGDYDLYQFNLIGGVDYVVSALGVSTAGGTLRDPAIAIYDGNLNLIAQGDNSFALGADPLVQFSAGCGQK